MIEAYIERLKQVILACLEEEDVKVVLFGSRSRGDDARSSDVDIGILPRDGFDRRKLTLLREQLEELNVPYRVDLVDLSAVSEGFREMVMKEAVVWKD